MKYNLNIQERPRKLRYVVGQDMVTETLRRQMAAGSVGAAYIFEGHFGCGKTTTANILAMYLNCENPQDGEPCCECASCKSIMNGECADVIDINASKETRKDDVVQAIIEASEYQPLGKKKVFIVDECQSLSAGAWGAMLKLLEEPPEYVTIIFCTTNAEKIPAAILSRCQKFHFSAIPESVIAAELTRIAKEHQFQVTEDVCRKIAHNSNGAMRDAKKILNLLADENDFGEEAVTRILFGDIKTGHRDLALALTRTDIDGIGRGVDAIAEAGENDFARALTVTSRLLTDAMELKYNRQAAVNYTEQYLALVQPLTEASLASLAAACDAAFKAKTDVARQNDATMCKVGLICNVKQVAEHADVAEVKPVIDDSVKQKLEELIGQLTKRVSVLETTVQKLLERPAEPPRSAEPIAREPVSEAPSEEEEFVVTVRPICDDGDFEDGRSMAELSEDDGYGMSFDDFFG